MSHRLRRITVAVSAATVAVLAAGGFALAEPSSSNDWPYAQQGHEQHRTFTLATVGDIACEPDTAENSATPAVAEVRQSRRRRLLGRVRHRAAGRRHAPRRRRPARGRAVRGGQAQRLRAVLRAGLGRAEMLERPAPGNHEYYAYTKHGDNEPAQNGSRLLRHTSTGTTRTARRTRRARRATTPRPKQGWYSYDLGDWHVISLNIECNSAPFNNDCSTTDNGLLAQETRWLAADLQSQPGRRARVAYWHQPTFSATTSTR